MVYSQTPAFPGMFTPLVSKLRSLVTPRKPDEEGLFVAEVYLTWFFGRGRTMYQKRFATRSAARRAARAHAILLDILLPHYWWDKDWSGNPYKIEHEFGINWCVRGLRAEEREHFQQLDRRTLAIENE